MPYPCGPIGPGGHARLGPAVTGANEPAPEYYRLRVDAAKGWQKYPLALRAGDRVPLVRRAAVAVLGTMGEASDLALVEAELQGPDRLLAVAARAAAEKIRPRAVATEKSVNGYSVRIRLEDSRNLDIVGEQIRVVTPDGARYTDFLVRSKKTGRVKIIEVKTGNASRDARQLLKDSQIANPSVDTFFKGRRGRKAGIADGTPTGSLRTFEINADNLNR